MSKQVKRPPAKRQYESNRRQEQARETRLRIIEAAHARFVEKGYGRTTIAEVATDAGVAVETVYSTFRNKPALLHQVWYATFRGDPDDVRLLHRPEIQELLAEPDLATRIRAMAVVYTPIFRRFTPLMRALQGAASSEAAAADLLAEFDERRLDACEHHAAAAAATGRLVVTETDCRDLLFATMDGNLWHRLVQERGWSDDRFAAWLGGLWTTQLVRS